jgi:hypothetical protein
VTNPVYTALNFSVVKAVERSDFLTTPSETKTNVLAAVEAGADCITSLAGVSRTYFGAGSSSAFLHYCIVNEVGPGKMLLKMCCSAGVCDKIGGFTVARASITTLAKYR